MAQAHAVSHVETGRMPHWRAATWAGLIGGLAFVASQLILVSLVAGESPWGPVRMVGAILLGREVLPPPATYELGATVAAAVVHFGLSVIYAWILALLIFRYETGKAIGIGVFFGLALYAINFFIFSNVFPWFVMSRTWITVVSHIAYGGIAAWAYKGLATIQIEHEGQTVA